MKFLKTHTGAMVVLAVVIVLSVLLGSHRSLVQAREKVEAQFAPIAGDLQDCLDITANLLTVAGRYLDEGELGELMDSRAALAESGGITEAHAAYERLLGDAETVFLKLEDCVLSGRDADYVKGFRTDLAAEQDTIARDGYNAAADRYNERDSVSVPYEHWTDQPPAGSELPPPPRKGSDGAEATPERQVRHKRGQYGWVRLTDEEMDRLTRDLGPDELARCITYVDEAAQTTGNKNKWKDWNLVIRKCSKGRWGLERTSAPVGGTRKSASQGAAEDLRELHELFGEG
mgnify:CR=1 FL=1